MPFLGLPGLPSQRCHFLFHFRLKTLPQVTTGQKKEQFSPIPASLGRSPSSLHQSVYTRHKTEIFCQQRYTKLSAGGGSSSPAERRQCFPECRSSFKTMGRKKAKRREWGGGTKRKKQRATLTAAPQTNVYTCSAGLGERSPPHPPTPPAPPRRPPLPPQPPR